MPSLPRHVGRPSVVVHRGVKTTEKYASTHWWEGVRKARTEPETEKQTAAPKAAVVVVIVHAPQVGASAQAQALSPPVSSCTLPSLWLPSSPVLV